MPIAAVPNYLGVEFKDASPGLRFGMYLKLWGVNRRTQELLWGTFDIDHEVRGQQRQEREVKHENKGSALRHATVLNHSDKATMRALIERQKAEFGSIDPGVHGACFNVIAVAPFTTGLGNEHPLENGFAFLNPYGLPYLPGSGVKGVLRQAARELASGQWGDGKGWSTDKVYQLFEGVGDKRRSVIDAHTKQPVKLSLLDVLFGLESGDGDKVHVRGALSFWDVIPKINGDSLMVEIMTPHQSHYYQQKPAAGSVSPHDSGSPNPICFLTVPPGSSFTFHVVCDTAHLARLTRERAAGMSELFAEGETHWRSLLQHAFEHAFEWLGFGAKTAVGYGAMRELSSKEVAAFEVARLQCEWVDRTIGEIATRHKVPSSRIDDVIRGKHLAEAWSAIEDEDLKRKALADIQSRWQAKGWWESPPPGVASKAKAMYTTDGK